MVRHFNVRGKPESDPVAEYDMTTPRVVEAWLNARCEALRPLWSPVLEAEIRRCLDWEWEWLVKPGLAEDPNFWLIRRVRQGPPDNSPNGY